MCKYSVGVVTLEQQRNSRDETIDGSITHPTSRSYELLLPAKL